MRSLIRKLFLIPAIVIGLVRATRSSRVRSPRGDLEAEELIGPIPRRSLKRWAIEVGVILAIMGGVGLLVAASGVIPIKASSGHWPITRWFLEFSMARSVSLHARGITVPETLDDPARVLRGAGHYETGCRPCHGSPSLSVPRVAAEMTPEPPYLPEEIAGWRPQELFYIVKHGVKFTGMPAWPARERDDEVWDMVAFMLELPELDRREYEDLVFGNEVDRAGAAPLELMTGPDAIPAEVSRTCARCHGADGLGRGEGAFPKLASQKAEYLLNQLQAYASGERHSGIMQPIAAGLDPSTMLQLARYYSRRSHGPRSSSPPDASIARGREIAHRGIPSRKIPSCVDCHTHDSRRDYPILHGQYPGYLESQLELLSKEKRGGSEYARLMREFAHKLEKEEMRDVAAYFSSARSLRRRNARPRERGAVSPDSAEFEKHSGSM